MTSSMILEDHRSILDYHPIILDDHPTILDDHPNILDDHPIILHNHPTYQHKATTSSGGEWQHERQRQDVLIPPLGAAINVDEDKLVKLGACSYFETSDARGLSVCC